MPPEEYHIAQGAPVEHVLQAIILEDGNIPNIHSKINVIWKSPGQRRHNNSLQLYWYIIQHELGENLTLSTDPHLLSLQAKGKSPPNLSLGAKPDGVTGTLRYLHKHDQQDKEITLEM